MKMMDIVRIGNKSNSDKIIRWGIMVHYSYYFLTIIVFPQERDNTTFKELIELFNHQRNGETQRKHGIKWEN